MMIRWTRKDGQPRGALPNYLLYFPNSICVSYVQPLVCRCCISCLFVVLGMNAFMTQTFVSTHTRTRCSFYLVF